MFLLEPSNLEPRLIVSPYKYNPFTANYPYYPQIAEPVFNPIPISIEGKISFFPASLELSKFIHLN